jgi:hypothetical protein
LVFREANIAAPKVGILKLDLRGKHEDISQEVSKGFGYIS